MANLKLYSYYSPGEEKLQIISVNAENILEADKLVKEMGHNPLRLSCCVGIRVVFVNTNLIKRFVIEKTKGCVVGIYGYTSGLVFESPILDSKEDAIIFIEENKYKIGKPFTDVFFKHQIKCSYERVK